MLRYSKINFEKCSWCMGRKKRRRLKVVGTPVNRMYGKKPILMP